MTDKARPILAKPGVTPVFRLLLSSVSFIKPCYREYEGETVDSDSDSDSEEDEMEADAAAASLEFSYAVSPGFKH